MDYAKMTIEERARLVASVQQKAREDHDKRVADVNKTKVSLEASGRQRFKTDLVTAYMVPDGWVVQVGNDVVVQPSCSGTGSHVTGVFYRAVTDTDFLPIQ